ncbi:biotin--[acetyl-CoA-carboxylase] ligase [Novosphingobium piscinae]|uniref:biotin--[biotin carboxyl-carrier protein] ligase n=1 Tax=Novosphingobium piscinae TaxID=1507448 RepID=A0A7X1KQE4_9SPHN|nr:biotin--[acetyl-CoA-carboxylase] ligase [Novosphingobium piscinae]
MEVVAQTGSTNADLIARLAAGGRVAEGQWLVADRQTAGKGRQGRVWSDGQGNFMGSTLVHARRGDPPLHTLALVAGLAVLAAVGERLAPPRQALLKWPNDLLIGPAKLAGILLERSGDAVVIGVGVNLVEAPAIPGRETVALARFGPAPDRDTFAADLARAFAAELQRWRDYGLGPVIARWQAAAHPLGTPLLVGEPGEAPLVGTFGGLDADGALLLRGHDGTTRTIHAGEVRLAPSGTGTD